MIKMTCSLNFRCEKCFSCDTEQEFITINYNEKKLHKIICFCCGTEKEYFEKEYFKKEDYNNKNNEIYINPIECYSKTTGNIYIVSKYKKLKNGKILALEKIKKIW